MPDVIWHEYAHSVMYNLYFTVGGQPFGLQNQSLAEGLADAFSALMEDDPTIGNDFFGAGTMLRSVQNTAKWPDDNNPNAHNTALIVGGALWDLRMATSVALTARLRHFALKIGFPDDGDSGVAFSEFFIDMLDADDNDQNLSNGTPNMNAIVTAFNAHGIGTAYLIATDHVALDDQSSNGPYPVNATVQYNSPIGSFVSSTLYYSVNNSPYLSVPMLPTGNPDEYGAEISQQSFGIVRYYLQFTDSFGGKKTMPGGAPSIETYTFLAGNASPIVNLDMESNPGWTVGFTGDAATSGIWVLATPVPSGVQPGEDHSPSGTQCWVTGNSNVIGDPPGTDDVDGGKTTLVTNTFDAVGGSLIQPVVSYWYWFSNNVGDNPSEDPWRVYISNNNGSTWTLVKSTLQSTNEWRREAFFIKSYVTPTNQMKMRFVAQDSSNLSLVEAGIDDFLVVGYTTVGVDPPRGPSLAMARAFPNPFRRETHIQLSLPSAGRVDISVFDLAGRKLRTLLEGDQAAGVHDVVWDGRSTSGQRAASGPYYLRMTRGDRVISRGVVLIR